MVLSLNSHDARRLVVLFLSFSFLFFCFICSLVGVDGRIRAKLSSFGKAALRQKQVWFGVLGL